jgi:hypothetical protein
MRILDQDQDRSVSRAILYLTMEEASELRDSLNAILNEPREGRHEHVSSEDYVKELTVCVYSPSDLAAFDERSKKLILEDS